MAISICCQDKVILRCRNTLFDVLHENILILIEENEIKIPANIENLLERTSQNIYGFGAIGADIADYIKTKKDLMVFSYLVKHAIEKYKEEYPDVPQSFRDVLWNFHKELLKYGEELEE